MNKKIKLIVRQIFSWLAAGDIEKVIEYTKGARMSRNEIEMAIREYGKTLYVPPEDAFDHIDVVEVRNANIPQFSVRMPFWTKEEGKSDLTLELTIKMPHNGVAVELDDIHVL